jgi:cohesin complex subunit SA-1/2
MLQVLWKTKSLPTEDEPTPEEIRYKEALNEQRESLLEKLNEYAVETQSNTVEGVRRAVSQVFIMFHSHWMNIVLGF